MMVNDDAIKQVCADFGVELRIGENDKDHSSTLA